MPTFRKKIILIKTNTYRYKLGLLGKRKVLHNQVKTINIT